ncbi:L,D-transpeptidase family protein [Adlercreutzia faecimuris]|uniref:L,D-transpeptidase family protein n=1 Tax=Adlercreutzia faecimuris TaxID=2897341 RepID=A0ABS9WG05_9ACTN|nr:L,D-transpeptidase family protein [Adlercreutzia sp. JBNU-10]MCI2241788.1 L,D-transpeptidase family protein [Adlercreutzia sp. JBNU-10]
MLNKSSLHAHALETALAFLLMGGALFASPNVLQAWAGSADAGAQTATGDTSVATEEGKDASVAPTKPNATQKPPAQGEADKDPATPPAVDADKPSSKPEEKPKPDPEPEKPITYKPGWSKDVKGQWHYGNADGKARTGWLNDGGIWYYLDPAQGGLMRTGRYQDTTGNWYYSIGSGAMQRNGWALIDSRWYYLTNSGAMHRGWLHLGHRWYWLDPSSECAMASGLYQAEGRWYTSGPDGACRMGGWSLVGDKWFWTDVSGATVSGWIRPNGRWYWLDPAKHGEMATGLYQANGQWYTAGPDGACRMGGWSPVGAKWFWTDSSGAVRSGWLYHAGLWYWLDPAKHGEMATGFYQANGESYYSDASGAMAQNTWVAKEDKNFFATSSGALLEGGERLKDGCIVFKDKDGKALTGWQSLGGRRFYADPAKGGRLSTGWIQVEGTWYWTDAQHVVRLGWMNIDGRWYWLEPPSGAMATGWKNIDGTWYFLHSSGAMATGWINLSGTWYYLSGSGAMVTGRQYIDGTWCDFTPSGAWIDPSAAMNAKAQGIASATPWLILVDTGNTRVNVYSGSQGRWSLQHSWLCAPGAPSTPTIKGYFTVGGKGYYFDSGASRCFYYTQFRGNYLFHSTLYNKRPTPSSPQDNRVGMQLSHGCVRLELQNAKWIYDNIPRGTKVYVF